MNDDFFKRLLEVRRPDKTSDSGESGEQGEQIKSESEEDVYKTLFEKFLEFANECYIHGVTVGIQTAIEMYNETHDDADEDSH